MGRHGQACRVLGILSVVTLFISIPIIRLSTGNSMRPLQIADLIENWNFSITEFGGWNGNDHNMTRPANWQFSGDTQGTKEQYRLINDTAAGGDVNTLYVRPTKVNQEHAIMFWQDFTPTNINQVTIQHHSRATGFSAIILLYGLNDTISEDTPLPNGTLAPLIILNPRLGQDVLEYWINYTTYTIPLSGLPLYHHYRIHWQIIEMQGKPDAELFLSYCRVTESLSPLPFQPPVATPILVIAIIIAAVAVTIATGIFLLWQKGWFSTLFRRLKQIFPNSR